jgi:septum formation protein
MIAPSVPPISPSPKNRASRSPTSTTAGDSPAMTSGELPPLFLASQSPRRREILADLGVRFATRPSRYEENPLDVAGLPPLQQAARLALLKATNAIDGLESGLVVGADTIVVSGDHILGKPRDRHDAVRMLHTLSGIGHQVVTGLAVIDAATGRALEHAEVTTVFFRNLAEHDIDRYVSTPEPYDKAGAYAIQGRASLFVERIEGCYFNVVGFPVVAFARLLEQFGFDLLDFTFAPAGAEPSPEVRP